MSRQGLLNRFLNGKGFYVALGVCMIAIGIAAWTAMSNKAPADTAQSSDSTLTASNVSETQVAKPQSDVEDTRSESEEETSSSVSDTVSETVSAPTETPVARFFTYPVAGEVIKKFSDNQLQYSVTFNDMRMHSGIDIKANTGTSVKSAGDGVVTSVENDPALGYAVTIDHGNGITAKYSGLTKAVTVKKGDRVKSGSNLGPLGTVTSESLDAPHLHLEFYKNGKPTDPLEYIE